MGDDASNLERLKVEIYRLDRFLKSPQCRGRKRADMLAQLKELRKQRNAILDAPLNAKYK